MQTMSQLKNMHEQMAAELARLPQYRALKAMDRFLAELSQIYDGETRSPEKDNDAIRDKINMAIESRIGADTLSMNSTKVTPYIPGHRVA